MTPVMFNRGLNYPELLSRILLQILCHPLPLLFCRNKIWNKRREKEQSQLQKLKLRQERISLNPKDLLIHNKFRTKQERREVQSTIHI